MRKCRTTTGEIVHYFGTPHYKSIRFKRRFLEFDWSMGGGDVLEILSI